MDAITFLKREHADVEKLFKQFEKAGDSAYKSKRSTVDRIVEALSVHAAIEEQVFYPVVRATVPATEELTLESLEEHHIVKWVLSELERLAPEDERFDAKVTVLMENVRHHVEEEEQELFPKVRDRLSRTQLGELGDALARARRGAPTHPHPRAPDTPPGNVVAGVKAGAIDRVTDTVRGVAEGGVAAASDLVATVTGQERHADRPTGSSTARSAADRTRAGVDDVTAGLIDRFTEVAEEIEDKAKGAARTARKAASSSRKTAGRAASKTTSTAKRRSTAAKKTASKTASKAASKTAAKAGSTAKKAARKAPARPASASRTGARSTARTAKRTTTRTAASSR